MTTPTKIECNGEKTGRACKTVCGTRGMCPGQAILVSFVAGYGLQSLTGLDWILYATVASGSIVLIFGLYRYLNPLRYLKQN